MIRCPLLLVLVLATVITISSIPVAQARSIVGKALFRCRGAERCGLFSVLMHQGTQDSSQCQEFCIWFPSRNANLSCGGCGAGSTQSVPTPSPVSALPLAPVPSNPNGFNIQLNFVNIPPADRNFFTSASTRWESVIVEDLTDISSAGFRRPSEGCTFPSIIDDLYICAAYQSIDGPKQVLGSAGPSYTRDSDGLPVVGSMVFDSADISFLKGDGGFLDTILHEMGHVIGVGTLWRQQGAAGSSFNCPYRGSNANREYRTVSGCSNVPTEQNGGRGTACGHWDEECMVNELMTGFLKAGTKSSLSRITIGSLQDLGYQVDYSKADQYTNSNLGSGCSCRRERSMMEMFHGETLQLGMKLRPGTKPRRLSDESHQMALETGLALLTNRTSSLQAKGKASRAGDGITYIGDQVVSIIVRDGDEVFGVVVRRDS